MKLKHYYHMYVDGHWQVPYDEHIRALTDSGLLEQLDFVGIGMVGTDSNRSHVKKFLPEKFTVVAEAGSGWEQVTHTPLSKDTVEPSKILYAHTKGAANYRPDQDVWRREMTDGVVYHWKECVDLLDDHDAVGCRWRRDPWRHYSGTFWWATSSYISTLAPISYVRRDTAEAWIGESNRSSTHVEIDPSHPYLGVVVHAFGRTFISRMDEFGRTTSNICDIGEPQLGDEFVGFPPTEGNKIIHHLMAKGATFSMLGDTIIVKSVKG